MKKLANQQAIESFFNTIAREIAQSLSAHMVEEMRSHPELKQHVGGGATFKGYLIKQAELFTILSLIASRFLISKKGREVAKEAAKKAGEQISKYVKPEDVQKLTSQAMEALQKKETYDKLGQAAKEGIQQTGKASVDVIHAIGTNLNTVLGTILNSEAAKNATSVFKKPETPSGQAPSDQQKPKGARDYRKLITKLANTKKK